MNLMSAAGLTDCAAGGLRGRSSVLRHGGLAEPLRLENPTTIVPGDRVTHLGLRRVHGIAQMRDTHTGDDCRIPEDDRCVREVVE